MTTTITNTRPSRQVGTHLGAWTAPDGGVGYRCEIRLEGDKSRGYVGYIAQLDSAVSQGDDLESAIKNVIEAFQGCIETCLAEGMPIPWTQPEARKNEEQSYWAVVDV